MKLSGFAPEWMTEESLQTLQAGYLSPGETPLDMYQRVARAAAKHIPILGWETVFFTAMWKNWLCPATPVLTNMGTDRGLPLSCNSIHVGDSVEDIFTKVRELALLSKNGAGVGIYLGDVRGRGAPIKGNGRSEGIIPWAKVFDSTIVAVSQGNARRGAGAFYLPIEHADIEEFLQLRRQTGDQSRRALHTNHGVCISDEWMASMEAGDKEKRRLWLQILTTRFETGEPYLLFSDAVNRNNPDCYAERSMNVKTSNICTEIVQYTDVDHTFVCCLSSLNLMRWEEWKDSNLPYVAAVFLDCVMSEYIQHGASIPGLENSIRSAVKGRALGIGVLGWHSLLQSKSLPFDSFESMQLNARIFKRIRSEAERASSDLAVQLGEPEWCSGSGRRNTHLLAVAPTVSNSAISGGWSAGIEPIAANVYSVRGAKGTFVRHNEMLRVVLAELGYDDEETWKSILKNSGSVQHLDFLGSRAKAVFLTAREINQFAIVRQAVQRQVYVDQAQSVNLFFASNSDEKYIHQVHMEAWKTGLKTLYYLRSEGVLRGDLASRSKDECEACGG